MFHDSIRIELVGYEVTVVAVDESRRHRGGNTVSTYCILNSNIVGHTVVSRVLISLTSTPFN